MSNDSSTGGYLSPASSPAPLEDDALDDFLQNVFVALTGLPANMVRPRWQPEPPNLPDVGTNWMAFGIANRTPDTYAVELHNVDGQGTDELQRHEALEILVSSYGPNANRYLNLLRDGLQISQNREVLSANAMAFIESTNPVNASMLVKEKWLRRVDVTVRIRRQIRRLYPVFNLLSANGTLNTEVINTPIIVTQ